MTPFRAEDLEPGELEDKGWGEPRLPEIHTIYLVPPWLPVSDGPALRMPLCQFGAIQVERREGSADDGGRALMDELLRVRMPEIEELIAGDGLRELYRMSGGVQRVLFQLLHAVAGRSRDADVAGRARCRQVSGREDPRGTTSP